MVVSVSQSGALVGVAPAVVVCWWRLAPAAGVVIGVRGVRGLVPAVAPSATVVGVIVVITWLLSPSPVVIIVIAPHIVIDLVLNLPIPLQLIPHPTRLLLLRVPINIPPRQQIRLLRSCQRNLTRVLRINGKIHIEVLLKRLLIMDPHHPELRPGLNVDVVVHCALS